MLFVVGLILGSAPIAFAEKSKKKAGWRMRMEAELATEYDDNVFSLDGSGKRRVDDQDPVNRSNGRLEGMESVDDFGVIPRLGLEVKGRTSLGRLSFAPHIAYHQYIENTDLSFPVLGLRVRQALHRHSAIRLDIGSKIGVFKRNYLKDTVGIGMIDPSERIYDQGIYDEWDLALAYQRRLWRGKRNRDASLWLTEIGGEIEVEYGERYFRNGFSNRDRDKWRASLSLDSDLGEYVDLGVAYRFSAIDTPGDEEVLILDEPAVGGDLNGDNDALDNNIRADAEVDRSRKEHRIAVELKLRPLKRLRLWTTYAYSIYRYDSDGRLDLSYRNRRDEIHAVEVGAKWKLTRNLDLALEAKYADRDVDRPANLTDEDEVNDKERTIVRLTLGGRF